MGREMMERIKCKEDIFEVVAFLRRMRSQYGESKFYHLGDLCFRFYYHLNTFDFDKDFVYWKNNNKVIGCALYLRDDENPDILIDPEYYDGLFEQAHTWCLSTARTYGAKKIETGVMVSDTDKRTRLIDLGWQSFDDPYVFMTLSLNKKQEVQLEKGYSFATSKEHRARGITSPMTKDGYDQMINAFGYKDELGVRVIHNNSVAAGCIAWLDEDGTAELEPVGTHVDHRRKGLASQVIKEVINRLIDKKASKLYVRTQKSNSAAVKLYESLGFIIADEDIGFEKDI